MNMVCADLCSRCYTYIITLCSHNFVRSCHKHVREKQPEAQRQNVCLPKTEGKPSRVISCNVLCRVCVWGGAREQLD